MSACWPPRFRSASARGRRLAAQPLRGRARCWPGLCGASGNSPVGVTDSLRGSARQPGSQDLADRGVGDAQHLAPSGDHLQHRERSVLGGFDDREVVDSIINPCSALPGAFSGRVAQGLHPPCGARMADCKRRHCETPHVWRLGLSRGRSASWLGTGARLGGQGRIRALTWTGHPASPWPRLRQGTGLLRRPEDHQRVRIAEEVVSQVRAVQLRPTRTALQGPIAVGAPIQLHAPLGQPAERRDGRQNHVCIVRIARRPALFLPGEPGDGRCGARGQASATGPSWRHVVRPLRC